MRLGTSGLLAMQSILPFEEANTSGRALQQDAAETADDLADVGGYNLNLQIAGVFIIIATSFLGMGLAFVMEHLKERRGR